jgi:hypothetical protein
MKKDKLMSFRTTSENQVYLKKLAKDDRRSVSFIIDIMVKVTRDLKIQNINEMLNMKELFKKIS